MLELSCCATEKKEFLHIKCCKLSYKQFFNILLVLNIEVSVF